VLYCKNHPDAPLIEDYHAGDMICSLCGLVVGDRVIDVGSEWRTFSNDKNSKDMSRVGAAEVREIFTKFRHFPPDPWRITLCTEPRTRLTFPPQCAGLFRICEAWREPSFPLEPKRFESIQIPTPCTWIQLVPILCLHL